MDLEFENRNGKLVAVDDSGNVVPISLGETETDSLTTEDTVTEYLGYNYDEEYPVYPNQSEFAGTLAFDAHEAANNPVLTVNDVTVAEGYSITNVYDPFIVREGANLHCFFEIVADDSGSNVYYIGHATVETSSGNLTLSYDQEVLGPRTSDGAWNFPYTFKHQGTWYMLDHRPNSGIDLWTADSFPTDWSKDTHLVDDPGSSAWKDPTLIHYQPDRMDWGGDQETWYLITSRDHSGTQKKHILYADDLRGPYLEHPSNPLDITDHNYNAGRPWVREGSIIQPTRRGDVGALRISEMTRTSISAKKGPSDPLIRKWHTDYNYGTHHIDHVKGPYGNDIVVADTRTSSGTFRLVFMQPAAMRPAGVQLYLSSNLSIGSGDNVIVTDSRDYDYQDTASQGQTITIKDAGVYEVSGQAMVSGNSDETVDLFIDVNSNTVTTNWTHFAHSNRDTLTISPKRVTLNEGDTVELRSRNEGSNSITILGESEGRSTYLNIERVQ